MKMDKLMRDFEEKKTDLYKELLAKEKEELQKIREQKAKEGQNGESK